MKPQSIHKKRTYHTYQVVSTTSPSFVAIVSAVEKAEKQVIEAESGLHDMTSPISYLASANSCPFNFVKGGT